MVPCGFACEVMHIQEVHIRRQIQGTCAAEHRVVVVLPMPCSYAFLNLDGPASAGVQTDRHESNRGWHESQRGQPVAVAVAGPMQEPDTKLYLEHESSCPRGWARLCPVCMFCRGQTVQVPGSNNSSKS